MVVQAGRVKAALPSPDQKSHNPFQLVDTP